MNKRFRLGNHIISVIVETKQDAILRLNPVVDTGDISHGVVFDNVLLCGSAADLTKVDNRRQVTNDNGVGATIVFDRHPNMPMRISNAVPEYRAGQLFRVHTITPEMPIYKVVGFEPGEPIKRRISVESLRTSISDGVRVLRRILTTRAI